MPHSPRLLQPPRHVLLVRTDHLGDMLLTLPAATALKAAYPGCRLTVLASPANAEAARHHPDVDAVEVDPFEAKEVRIRGVWRLARRIRGLGCDVAIVVRPAPRLALAIYLAGVPVRIGTAYRGYSVLFNVRVRSHRRRVTDKHEVQLNLRLLRALGIPTPDDPCPTWRVDPADLAAVGALLDGHGVADRRLVVLHPGNAGSALNWSAAQYGELGRRLVGRGFRVAVTGSARETALTRQVADLAGPAALDFGGQMSLPRLAALIRLSALYVGSATGPTHLAAAVDTPVLGLYSPMRSSRPERWRPLGPRVAVLQPPVDMVCPECLGQRCPYYHCMERHLSVDGAERAALRWLDVAPPGPAP